MATRHSTAPTTRRLKVRTGHAGYDLKDGRAPRPIPWLDLKGYWLQQAGFDIGAPVQIEVDQGRLVITVQDGQAG